MQQEKRRGSFYNKAQSSMLVLLSLVVGIAVFLGLQSMFSLMAPHKEPQVTTTLSPVQNSEPAPDVAPSPQEQTPASPPANNTTNIQSVVDAWAKKYPNLASVIVADAKTGEVLAKSNDQQEYFAASIYKLYVAYLAAQDIDSGAYSAEEPAIGTYNRKECIVRMIQFSDSPCAEAMLGEMGKKSVDLRLKAYGVVRTSHVSLTTTAADTALITRRIAQGEGLSAGSATMLQQAMANQIYRDALAKGFSKAQVANKVGFYETGYHDTAIVTINGRSYIVTVLSKDMGSRQIAELARSLQDVF